MLKAIEGIFRNGKIELLEQPSEPDETRVVVTFLPQPKRVDLASLGIDKPEAAALRAQFASIAEDWDRPEMDVYDAE